MGLLNPQKPFFLEIVLVSDTEAFKTYDVTNHLKKFEYSVISEDGGGLSYTINVINPLETVEALVKEYYVNHYADVEGPRSPFPKILIQWGYGKEKEDGISKVHLATVTDLNYTFSSGKEKMLSIKAVGDPSFMDHYTKGFLRTEWVGPPLRNKYDTYADWNPEEQYTGSNLIFTDVIEKLLGGLISQYPLTKRNIVVKWDIIEPHLRNLYNLYVAHNGPKEEVAQIAKTATKLAAKEAAFKILEHFGFDVQLRTFKEDFNSGLYKIVYSKMGPGGLGLVMTETKHISINQLAPGSQEVLNKLKKARELKVGRQPLNTRIDGGDINPDGFPEGFDPDAEGLEYKVISTPDEITTQKIGPGVDFEHVRIRTNTGVEFDSTVSPEGSLKIEASKLSRHKLAIQNDEKFQKIATDSVGLDRDWKAALPEKVEFEDLSDEQKDDLLHETSRLVVFWDSPEGTPLKKTIFELLEKINILLEDPEMNLVMYVQSPALFEGRGKKTLREVYDSHVQPKSDVTTLTITHRDSVGENDSRDEDMKIFSYPQLNIQGESFNNSLLTYGGNDSTVRFFDFTSDLSYMVQSLQGIKTFLGMNNNAQFLTYDRITESIFYFVDKLTDSDLIIKDEDRREKLREAMSMQQGHDRTAVEITEDTLRFLKSLGKTINSKDVRAVLNSGAGEKEESFRAFVAMLQNKASLSAFFNLQAGKHSAQYEVFFGSDSETFDAESDVAYTLKKYNLFDQFLDKTLTEDRLIKLYASDYLRGYPVQVRAKSLGIPELDTIMDVNSLRSISFDVHDLSRERITGVRNIHWLSGTYTPFEIKHTVSPSEGYLTEFSLLRNPLGTSKREDNND